MLLRSPSASGGGAGISMQMGEGAGTLVLIADGGSGRSAQTAEKPIANNNDRYVIFGVPAHPHNTGLSGKARL